MFFKGFFARHKKIIIVILRLVVTVILGSVVLYFLIYLVGQKTKKIFERRNLLALSFRREEIISKLRSDWALIEPKVSKMETIFPSSEDLPQIITAVENAALQTKNTEMMRLSDLSAVPEIEGILRLRFEQDIGGNFGTFLGYFDALDKIPYIIQIESITINAEGSIDDKSTLQVSGYLYLK